MAAAVLVAMPARTDQVGAGGVPVAVTPAPVTPEAIPIGHGRTVRMISRGGASSDALLGRVAGELGAAVDAVDRFGGTDWGSTSGERIEVVAAASDQQFVAEGRLDPQREWPDIAAVAVADDLDPVGRRASGQRIVLAPGAASMSDEALRIVLRHELFHLAARADTAPDAPRWLTEGVADFVARPPESLPPGAAATMAAAGLPTDAALDAAAGPARALGYDRAWWFARFVADVYGVDALRRLYLLACGHGHADLPNAVRQALGTDMNRLENRWAAWLTG